MGPYLSTGERFGHVARLGLPYGALFLFFVFADMAVISPLSMIFKAPFFLMGLYYWSVYRPTLLPPFFVFLAGLMVDVLSGVPLGLNALFFLVARMMIVDQRRFLVSQPFAVIWLGFVGLNIIMLVMQWGLYSLLAFEFSPVPEAFHVVFFGMALFPLVYWILHVTHKILPHPLLKGV